MALIKSSNIISVTGEGYFITKAYIKNIITSYRKNFQNNRDIFKTKCRKMELIFSEHLCSLHSLGQKDRLAPKDGSTVRYVHNLRATYLTP